MSRLFQPWQLLVTIPAGWMTEQQRQLIEYLRTENRRPRFEPRSNWPRGAPCAKPSSLVKGRPGAKVGLQVEFHAERKHLPIVKLRRAA
jgi:hypothetical protein